MANNTMQHVLLYIVIHIALLIQHRLQWSNEKRLAVGSAEIPLTILLQGSFKLDNNNCIAQSEA